MVERARQAQFEWSWRSRVSALEEFLRGGSAFLAFACARRRARAVSVWMIGALNAHGRKEIPLRICAPVASRCAAHDVHARTIRLGPAALPAPAVSPFARKRGMSPFQVFGKVTPVWPWYFPPRSLYDVEHTSSDSKNSICATPSLA